MDKPQFDQPLGGSQTLPPRMQLAKLLEPRLQEIQTMRNFLKAQTSTKLAFQTLPKHMRRRAMSHNVKRLPRRLRDIHTNQMRKSGTPVSQKRPSRRYRRRPANLSKEYQMRDGKRNRWLKTHVWHAKRFHMTERWGYKLPYSPCSRAFRSCYRAVTKYCLAQDISYVSCLQIEGFKSLICEKLQKLGQSGTGLNISAKAFSSGNREGNIVLYDISGLPIGPVKFQWQPSLNLNEVDPTNNAKLWLWVHAAFLANTSETLVKLFELDKNGGNCETCCYTNETTKIVLTNLGSQLSRLRLTGPLANAVLHDTFVLNNKEPQNSWISRYFTANPQHLQNMTNQAEVWQNLNNVADVSEISPHIVVSLIVKDPRFNIPQKRTKVNLLERKNTPISSLVLPTVEKPQSPIWEEQFRRASVATKMSSHKINEVCSKLLVPGSAKPDTDSLVPVMLIQQPGNRTGSIGFGSGWDLVIPSEWSVPFWISIMMRCARPGGLRENDSILFEAGKTNCFFAPDTEAGRKEEEDLTKRCKDKFFRKPPNKRTNFNKFNIASPFECKWKLLIGDWKTDGDKQASAVDILYVIRQRDVLCQIEQSIQPKKKTSQTLPNCIRDDCLVPVKVTCNGKGRLRDFAIICLPKPNENDNRKRKRNGDSEDPVEPVSVDVHQKKRKELRKTHQTLLKRLRRKRIKHKREHKKKVEPDVELLANYTKKMRELWLPEPSTIRNSCSRQVMGFVQTGGFSYFLGQSSGVGYIAGGALPELLKLPVRNKVLVRNTNTRQYRWARLSIITDFL